MNRTLYILLGALLCLYPALSPAASPKAKVVLSPKKVGPGDLLLISVKNTIGPVEGTFDGQTLYFNPAQGAFKAVVGIDLLSEPRTCKLVIVADGKRLRRTVRISKKEYPIQHLKLPKDMVELSPEDEARVEREQKKVGEIWPGRTDRMWTGNFTNPRDGEISTKFGVKRFMNDMPKNPHTGVDVAANEGDEVRAPNNGAAILVDDLFFSGNSIVLDHGQGIYTMFFHLSKTFVTSGQQVKKGDVIGLVGSTGRSTGAHLHWGARVQGARVDPLELIGLNLE